MKVAIVYFQTKNSRKLVEISQSLAKGIESAGHQVDLIDGIKDKNTKLSIYKYIAIGTCSDSFLGSSIPDEISPFLASCGMISGKRCFAFIIKSFMQNNKTLSKLMHNMEKEGMYLKNSEIFSKPEDAETTGKQMQSLRSDSK